MTKLNNEAFKKDKKMMDLNGGSLTKEQEECDHDFGDLNKTIAECSKCGLRNMTTVDLSESDLIKIGMGWWQ
ncbi:hypothetical protein LCGC14_1685380 [marine sediment metagenome]|uniref:Uncharacterized protein n=1 Tax=marine sediment metagenome TaxID=412755 RepID=A0A0F9HMF4_9ZZZZ